jgi:DNA-binding transcriptional ArsR family regulator
MKETTPKLLDEWTLEQAAECLRIMGHPTRLRIVDILMQGEFPVGRIAAMCELPSHQLSEHLRMLKNCGFLASERRGREVYYHLDSPRLPALLTCIRKTCGRA